MFAAKDTLLTRPSGGAYQISRSVRTRASATAYLNRTPAVASNRQKWTWSGWVKRGSLTSFQQMFTAGTGASDRTYFLFTNTDTIQFYSAATSGVADYSTSALFRDPAAWYHIQLAFDSTQATAANRVFLYINGVQQTLTATITVAQNTSLYVNSTVAHTIGRESYTGANYLDGYLTEINFIDGQALTPSSFGETNAITGVWQPKKYAGTYGTNGFYLNFSDNSTAAALGTDFSGNSNTWTVNNISVTAGATYDSMIDVPTLYADGGNGRGNYAVLNPLWKLGGSGYITPTNGNLRASIGGTNNIVASTMQLPSSGKWYMEFTLTTGVYAEYGLCNSTASGGGSNGGIFGSYYNAVNQYAIYNGSAVISDGNQAWVTGDIGLIAVDVSNNKLWIGRTRSGTTVWMGGGSPSAGTSPSFSASGGGGVYSTSFDAQTFNNPFVASGGGSDVWDVNFGQRPFTNTPPTGFVALNTQNLPEPTISNGASYMAATLYTGNATARTIANTVNGISFQPDLVWLKMRSSGSYLNHHLVDSVRGDGKVLYSNLTNAEDNLGSTVIYTTSTGFGLSAGVGVNENSQSLVGWQWNAGGSTVTNTERVNLSTSKSKPHCWL
jgi:hypothetical protein